MRVHIHRQIFATAILFASSHALLVEQFANNQVDYVPASGFGQAPNTVNGYVYAYKGPATTTLSVVNASGVAVSYSAAMLQAATAFQPDSGLVVNVGLASAAGTYGYGGIGLDWVKVGTGDPKAPIDLSAHTKVIVRYRSNQPLKLEWSQASDPETSDGTEFFCALPIKTVMGDASCDLAEGVGGFNQPSWVEAQARDFDLTNALGLKVVFKVDSVVGVYAGEAAHMVLRGVFLDDTTKNWPVVSSSSVVLTSSSSVVLTSSSSVVLTSSSSVVLTSSSSVVPTSSSSVVPTSSSSVAPVSSSSIVPMSSSSMVPTSSSSVTPVGGVIWQPSFANAIEFNGAPGGYWYTYADANSTIAPDADGLIANIATNSAIVATMTVGNLSPRFAAVGFDWVDNGVAVFKAAVNISGRGGLCVHYETTTETLLALKQQGIGDDNPNYVAKLPKTAVNLPIVVLAQESAFAKEGTWGTTYTKDLSKQTGVHFQIKAPGAQALKIYKVGFGLACGTPTVTLAGSSSSGVPTSSSSIVPASSSSIVPTSSSSVVPTSSSSIVPTSSSSVVPGSSSSAGTVYPPFMDDDKDGVLNKDEDDDGDLVPNYFDADSPFYIDRWKDDNSDGIPNAWDPKHPLYLGSNPILGRPVLGASFDRGFGFVGISNSEIIIRVENPGVVSVEVFDMSGRLLAKPFQGKAEGSVRIPWNGSSYQGMLMFRLQQGSKVRTTRGVMDF